MKSKPIIIVCQKSNLKTILSTLDFESKRQKKRSYSSSGSCSHSSSSSERSSSSESSQSKTSNPKVSSKSKQIKKKKDNSIFMLKSNKINDYLFNGFLKMLENKKTNFDESEQSKKNENPDYELSPNKFEEMIQFSKEYKLKLNKKIDTYTKLRNLFTVNENDSSEIKLCKQELETMFENFFSEEIYDEIINTQIKVDHKAPDFIKAKLIKKRLYFKSQVFPVKK